METLAFLIENILNNNNTNNVNKLVTPINCNSQIVYTRRHQKFPIE